MSEKKEKKLSEEAEKFFDFLDGPAVQGKIQEYIIASTRLDASVACQLRSLKKKFVKQNSKLVR